MNELMAKITLGILTVGSQGIFVLTHSCFYQRSSILRVDNVTTASSSLVSHLCKNINATPITWIYVHEVHRRQLLISPAVEVDSLPWQKDYAATNTHVKMGMVCCLGRSDLGPESRTRGHGLQPSRHK